MKRLPVNYRIDQKEANNGANQGSCRIVRKKRGRRLFGRLSNGQHQSKRFGNGLSRWHCAATSSMGKSKRCNIRHQKMSVGEWTAVGGFVIAILAAVYSSMRIIIKSVMSELMPNGGSSMKDQISRIEARLDFLYTQLIESDRTNY
jgi:hypothetical protein